MGRFSKTDIALEDHPDASFFGAAGPVRSAIDQFNQGTTAGWADEVIDPIAAGYGAMTGSGSFGDLYKDARDMSKRDLAAQQENNPWISGVSNLAGGLAGAVTGGKLFKAIAPQKAEALARFATANPKTAASLVGAGWGGISGAGTATGDAGDVAASAGINAAAGVPLGILGYGAASALGKVASSSPVKNLVNKFRKGAVSDPIAAGMEAAVPPPSLDAIDSPVSMLDQQDLARLSQGKVLPLTAGDRNQKVAVQRAEQMALENGSQPMAAARNQQQEATYKPFVSGLGDIQILDRPDLALRTQAEIENAANILRKQYDSLGGQVNAAYKAARETGEGVGINADAVQKGFLDTVNTNLSESSYIPGDVPLIDEKLGDLTKIMMPSEDGSVSVTAVKLKQLEQWKQRFNQGNFTSDQISEPTVKMHVKMIGRAYDDFLTNLADTSIVNGDQGAIDAFRNARSLAAQKFKFYDSDSTIQRILDSRDLSGENLVNVIIDAGNIAGKGDNGQLVSRMIQLAGDKAPQMRDSLKRGVLSKVLKDSLSGVKNPENLSRDLVRFANMRKSLGNLMQQKEVFGSIFDDTEQEFFKTMYKDLDLIASKQKGAINSSSTGAYMADFINGLGKVVNNPLFRSVPGLGAGTTLLKAGLEKQAASIVTGKAEKGLDEFIAQAISQIDAPAAYYGGIGGSSALDPIGNIMTQPDQPQDGGYHITVRPNQYGDAPK